jgi:hypothetical protein
MIHKLYGHAYYVLPLLSKSDRRGDAKEHPNNQQSTLFKAFKGLYDNSLEVIIVNSFHGKP